MIFHLNMKIIFIHKIFKINIGFIYQLFENLSRTKERKKTSNEIKQEKPQSERIDF